MSYNSDLQSYNTKIQSLINKANNLPDKEGGGSSITLTVQSVTQGFAVFYFTDDGTSGTISNAGTFILRGGILLVPTSMISIAVKSGNYYCHNATGLFYCFTSDSIIDIIGGGGSGA